MARLEEGVELVLYELRQVGSGGNFIIGKEGRGVLLREAVQRGLSLGVAVVVDGAPSDAPRGCRRDALHALFPRLGPRTVVARSASRVGDCGLGHS